MSQKYPSFLSSVQEAAESNVDSPKSSTIQPEKWSSALWAQVDVDYVRWNRLYPYRLAVVKATMNQEGEVSYSEDLKWQFTLPIPPQSLENSTNFAIELSALVEGVHAEHNAVVFKDITLSGTTGVLPLRGSAPSKNFNAANSIFGGTLAAAGRTAASAVAVANGGLSPNPNFVVPNAIVEEDIRKSTGYAQFHLLARFLENYANFKKTREGRDYRLVFSVYKDQESFLVEPQRFRLSRSTGSTFEYPYQLSLKAYGRCKLNNPVPPAEEFKPTVLNQNLLAKMLSTIQSAREVIYNANDVIRAIGLDLDNFLFEPLRKIALFVKEAIGSPLTLAEIPQAIVAGAKDAIVAYVAVAGYGSQLVNQANKPTVFNKMIEDLSEIAEITGLSKTQGGKNKDFFDKSSLKQFYASDAINKIFQDPIASYPLMSAISPGSLSLSDSTVRAINQERQTIKRMNRKDFEDIRNGFEKFLTDFEFSIGAGNSTVAELYGVKTPDNPLIEPNDEHYEVIYSLNKLIQETSKLAATRQVNRINIKPIEYVAGLATRSGIAFNVPVSKLAVPFPYGYTLEDLSRQYLGVPDRWMEIAQLNGLRTPYVDEVGFDKPLLAGGNGNEILVGDDTNLALGQPVWILSNVVPKTKRNIVKIERLSTHCVVTVDGPNDMANYHPLAGGKLSAFLPGTVNSQMSIYIPSSVEVDTEAYETKDIPGLEDFDPIIAAGGVDLLLDNNNDLIITPNGDTRLAIGLSNIIQRVRVMLSVTRGTLNQHPEFGLPIEVGASLADLDANQIAQAVKNMFDAVPGWSARDVKVNLQAPACGIAFNLFVPGTSQLIPVFFEITNAR